MGFWSPSSHKRQQPTREELEKNRRQQHLDLLYRKGVLIPPSFGTSTDVFPPPSASSSAATSSRGLGINCSAPHLILSSHVVGLGQISSDHVTTGSCLSRLTHYRLLGPEHMFSRGLFLSANAPSGLANATAGWAGAGAGGTPASTSSNNDIGFLTGAVLQPNHVTGSLSGVGGTVWTTSGTGDLAGHLGAFISRDMQMNGRLTGYAYAAGYERGGSNDASSGGDACAPPETSVSINNDNTSIDQRPSMAKIGWLYSHRLVPSTNDANNWPGGGGNTQYYRNGPFDEKKQQETFGRSNTHIGVGSSVTIEPHGKGVDVKGVSSHVTLSAPTSGFEGAIEASLPINSSTKSCVMEIFDSGKKMDPLSATQKIGDLKPNVSGFVSFDLNQIGESGGMANDMAEGPPIMVTLHQLQGLKSSESSATLSQTFTFDRIVTNPLEDRCPKIRNTISWAVRLKRSITRMAGYGPSNDAAAIAGFPGGSSVANTSLSAALAYQVNRGLCYKVQADSKDGVTFGVLLKRWAHPRITASLLFGSKLGGPFPLGSSTRGFKGICLQIESGPIPSPPTTGPPGTVPASRLANGDWLYGLAGSSGSSSVSGETPATKAELPDQ